MNSRAGVFLARFAVESKKLTISSVNLRLFQPNIKSKVSVFYIDELDCPAICNIGVDVAKKRNKEKLYGWAEVSEKVILEENLEIERDDDPMYHANIIGWPEDLAKRKKKQQEIALLSKPVLLKSPIFTKPQK